MISECDAHRLAISITFGHRNNSFVFLKFINIWFFCYRIWPRWSKIKKQTCHFIGSNSIFSILIFFHVFDLCFVERFLFLICFATPDLQNYVNRWGNGTGIFKNNKNSYPYERKIRFCRFSMKTMNEKPYVIMKSWFVDEFF